MSMSNRTVLICLGAIGLALAGIGTLVALNWDALSTDLVEAIDTQSAKSQATLFRWGEVMSIGAELEARYGAKPDVTYDTATGDRVLGISFSNYQVPGKATGEKHAREIAAFAIGNTKKSEQIDVITVQFQTSPSYSFALDDLMPAQSRARP